LRFARLLFLLLLRLGLRPWLRLRLHLRPRLILRRHVLRLGLRLGLRPRLLVLGRHMLWLGLWMGRLSRSGWLKLARRRLGRRQAFSWLHRCSRFGRCSWHCRLSLRGARLDQRRRHARLRRGLAGLPRTELFGRRQLLDMSLLLRG
jgi:hypothetical protein